VPSASQSPATTSQPTSDAASSGTQPSTPAVETTKSEEAKGEGNDDVLADESEAEQEHNNSDTTTDDPSDIDAEEDPESVLE
jgi:hypothetical protein